MLNGYGFDVYFHINVSNNLNLIIDSTDSIEPITETERESVKVKPDDYNKSFFDIIGKSKDEFRKIKPVHLQNVKIIKDPVDIHHNVYQVNFINIDRIFLENFKSGVIDYIIIRVGSEPDLKLKNSSLNEGQQPYDLMRLFLKPIKIDTPKNNTKNITDFELQCVSLTTYAMLYDKSFIGEIDGPIDQNNVTITGTTDVTVSSNGESGNFESLENSKNFDIKARGFGYGEFDSSLQPMSMVMPKLESFKNTSGKNFLKQVLTKLNIKYAVRYLPYNDAISPKSDFIYDMISIPSLNVLRFLEYAHEHYPPYMISIPWIFDDAHTNKDEGFDINLGYSYYKEVNILNPDILNQRNLVKKSSISGNHIIYNITDAVRYYPKEIAYHYKSSSFTFTDYKGTPTNFPSEYSNSRLLIPKDNGTGDIILDSVNIGSSENISISANYDALEFQKRLDYLFTHIDKDPTLLKVNIFGDFPAFIDFGYAYLLYANQKKNIIGTPFKIIHDFQHKENGLVLNTEVIMYVTNDT